MKKLLVILMIVATALLLTGCRCKHEETKLVGYRDETCTEDGYSGDTVCVECEETLTVGQPLSAVGHDFRDPEGVRSATCEEEGYTGDIYCRNCSEVVMGEAIPLADHIPGERQYASDPTCTREGYTGEVFCEVCWIMLEDGESIPELGHDVTDPVNVIDPTCLSEGYTGDTTCRVCEKKFEGEDVAKLEHTYENNVCTVCGWRTPGLYLNGNMEFSWEDLVNNSYVMLSSNDDKFVLKGVNAAMYGDLVLDESVVRAHVKAFENSAINSVWFPVDFKQVSSEMFLNAAALEEVHFYADSIELEEACFKNCVSLKNIIYPGDIELYYSNFSGCTSLESFDLPDDTTVIYGGLFENCSSLKSIEIPAGVKEIGGYVFAGCTSLTELVIPEGVEEIGENLINNSGITNLVLPSTVTELGQQIRNSTLETLDLSKTQLTGMGGKRILDCDNLRELKLPGLTEGFACNAFEGCVNLELLDIGDGTTKVYPWGWGTEIQQLSELTTIIWPASLIDGAMLADAPNLKTIYFCGSELQWNMTASKDAFPNVEIVFNYER